MNRRFGQRGAAFLDNVLDIILLSVVIIFIAYGSYALWDTVTVVQKASPVQYEVYKPTENDSLSFSDFQEKNPDTIGWLTIYGTNIDYPLMQAEDNDKYLTMDAELNYSMSGAIFLDYQNNPSFTDFNSIIYGHHMAYHAMFGDIEEFSGKDFFDQHLYGNLFYEGRNHGIELYAFTEADAYTSKLYKIASKEEEKKAYLKEIDDEALYKRSISVTQNDRLAVFSTCSSQMTNGRYILIGRITDEVYNNAFAVSDETERKPSSVFNTVIKENQDIVPLLVLGIVIILLLSAVMILKRHAKKSRR